MADRSASQPGWIAKIIRDANPGNEFQMRVGRKDLRRVVEASKVFNGPDGWMAVCWCETGVAAASALDIEDFMGNQRDVSFVMWYEDGEAHTIHEIELIL